VVLEVTTPLKYPNTPMSPRIEFDRLIKQAGAPGVLDPNSIRLFNLATGNQVLHGRSEDFAYGDAGRIEWVIENPRHTKWQFRFRTSRSRPPLKPQASVPAVGVGDLLRYNAGPSRPVTLFHSAGLHDLTGDGQPDLVGCWNYFYRPGDPSGGVIVHPAIDSRHPFRFGDRQRVRYFTPQQPSTLHDFDTHYNSADFADFNRDGRLDFVYVRRDRKTAQFFLGTTRRQPGGGALFQADRTLRVPDWNPCRAIDLDADGQLDLVLGNHFIRNTNPDGWPFEPAAPVSINAGRGACFVDLDQDNRLDAVHLESRANAPGGTPVRWRRNQGGNPPRFGDSRTIAGIAYQDCSLISPATLGDRTLLIIQHDHFQQLRFFEQVSRPGSPPRFRELGRAESPSAVLSLSDQAWPCLADWDGDGDNDLLVGGGYGWPRVVINEGTRNRPRYGEPRLIHSQDKPIRFLRNDILGPPENGHNMGYPYPVLADWDGDGLDDLLCPNETNRIFWFRNRGRPGQLVFGPRRQLLCDGFPDSPAMRARSALRAKSSKSNHGVYPFEPKRPFMWRTGIAVADFNGDRLLDFVTLEGSKPRAALFVQYRDQAGGLGLKRHSAIKLADGREVTEKIVNRPNGWTESFRAVDWNRDERIDLVYSVAGSHHGTLDGGSMYLLMNVGTKASPVFAPPQTLACFGKPIRITNHGPNPWIGDYDHDGLPDVIACVEWSVYPYYSHAALAMPAAPGFRLGTPELVQPRR